ncbi:MAG: pur operon repressor [Clostridia bacterium]|nr:pur operon repressor [Clostridia bacterium]
MDKFKRNERIAAMTKVLTSAPNRIFTLSYFCEMFGAAKSTVSEDVAILAETLRTFQMGTLETVTGAAGGMRYRPLVQSGEGRALMEKIVAMLKDSSRVLPGGFLYFSDILSDPQLVSGMGHIFAAEYYDAGIDFVLTMETKGIPVALMTAEALHVPLIIARRSSKVYEGSAVNINYVSGKGGIETMSLSRRAVREGSKALIVDDFMRGGGTARGMLSLLEEFNCKCAGMRFVMALENPARRMNENEKSLMVMDEIVDGEPVSIRVSDWVK